MELLWWPVKSALNMFDGVCSNFVQNRFFQNLSKKVKNEIWRDLKKLWQGFKITSNPIGQKFEESLKGFKILQIQKVQTRIWWIWIIFWGNSNFFNSTTDRNRPFFFFMVTVESKKKSKDRKAGFLVDSRKIYPPFKRDKDNFFMCDYTNPETGKPCNIFFGHEKSINAHYSRVHNKDNNPNRLRRLEKEGKIIEKILEKTPRPFSFFDVPKTKQSSLLEF